MSEPGIIDSLPPLRDVIARHGLSAEKKLGQNFLLDLNITDKIARAAGDLSGKNVIEIGPGPGGLTRSLIKTSALHVSAIEFDPRAVSALQELVQAAPGRLTVIPGDALACDLTTLIPAPRAIIANLPYNIATPLLTGWLAQLRGRQDSFDIMILMFQKEVAERMAAPPGGKDYGRLSILTQWLCQVDRVFDLPPSAFTPPPKVTSTVVRLIPRALPPDSPRMENVAAVTAAAFGQRRKMLRSSLKKYPGLLERAGIDPALRAEELAVGDFIHLAKCLAT
ncbi:MAG TPA: 16S rRNA (adenine(1518)-N(6)/adenine(1519)-N(6))-dimethyltransferase RsmA [Micavibrio sp.]